MAKSVAQLLEQNKNLILIPDTELGRLRIGDYIYSLSRSSEWNDGIVQVKAFIKHKAGYLSLIGENLLVAPDSDVRYLFHNNPDEELSQLVKLTPEEVALRLINHE